MVLFSIIFHGTFPGKCHVENVVYRQSMLLSPEDFSVMFDKLESVVGNIGKPGGSLIGDGDKRVYRYSPFHKFDQRTYESCSHGIRRCWRLFRGATCPRRLRRGLYSARRSSRSTARAWARCRKQARQREPLEGMRDRRSRNSGICRCVKLWDTEAAARAISPIVGPATTVLSLQNGVQKDDVLRRVLGDRPILGGSATSRRRLLDLG
jgi:hypothetical protein